MGRVRGALLVDLQKAQVITGVGARVGMQGMGGIGKPALAATLARNRRVRQAYPDVIAWISCGQDLPDNDLLACQRDLARRLRGDAAFASLAQGQAVLRDLLASKEVPLVLDAVWRAVDARSPRGPGVAVRYSFHRRKPGRSWKRACPALQGHGVAMSAFRTIRPSRPSATSRSVTSYRARSFLDSPNHRCQADP